MLSMVVFSDALRHAGKKHRHHAIKLKINKHSTCGRITFALK